MSLITLELVKSKINLFWETYPNRLVKRQTMIDYILCSCGVSIRDVNRSKYECSVILFLSQIYEDNAIGINSNMEYYNIDAITLPSIKLDQKETSGSKAINDYVCPTCKNNRCSITEISCWSCGNKL